MKKTIQKGILLTFLIVASIGSASAQFSLKKLAKTMTNSTESTAVADTSSVSSEDKLKMSDFHVYEARTIYLKDDNGNRLKTAAGTDSCRVQLFDVSTSPATMVSADAVKAQHASINKAVLAIAAKAAVGAGIGALSGGKKGALIGLAAGLGLSVPDIINIIKLKKDLSKQSKTLDAYEHSFNEEGQQVVAELDKDAKKALGDLTANSCEMTVSELKAEMEKDSYKTIASNESIENLLEASLKLDK